MTGEDFLAIGTICIWNHLPIGGYWESQLLNRLKRGWPPPQKHYRKTPAVAGGELATGGKGEGETAQAGKGSVVAADVR